MEKQSKISWLTLNFIDNEIEKSFREYYINKYLWQVRIALILSPISFLVFLISEFIIFRQINTFAFLKAIIIIPSFTIGYILSYTHTYFYQKYYQYFNIYFVLITSFSFILTAILVPPSYTYTFYIGVIICLLFNYTLIRQSFVKATIVGVIVFLTCFFSILVLNFFIDYSFIVYLAIVTFVGMFLSYITELDGKQSYMLLQQNQINSQKLADVNNYLEHEIQQRTEQILEANKTLEESKARLEDASKLAGLGYWIWDVATGDVQWSDEVYKIFGLNKETFFPKIDSIMNLSPWPEDNKRNQELIEKATEKKEKGEYQQKFLKTNGSIGYYRSTFMGEYDKAGNLIIIKGTVFDVTSIKEYEESLIEKNNELEIYKNQLESLVEKRTKELDKALVTTNELNQQLQTINEELRSSNEELYEKNNIILNQNEELKTTLYNLKHTQSQLIQAEKMASLGILTAGVAHEINNPLNYLMGAYVGLSNYFEEHGSIEKDNTETLINSINIGIERISGIVQGLNQFSRSNESMKEDCDIHSIIDNCLVILQNQTKHKVDIEKNYSNKQTVVIGNVGKMHQVFLNIFTNSIQAIPKKGKIVVNTNQKDKKLIIEIVDNGIGIDEKDLKQITDPFFTTKSPGEGTGLGLSITYSILKEHKGTIDFKSELQKGTRVMITLPLK